MSVLPPSSIRVIPTTLPSSAPTFSCPSIAKPPSSALFADHPDLSSRGCQYIQFPGLGRPRPLPSPNIHPHPSTTLVFSAAMSTGRKVFHCAVDETALTTNISEIKKWTTNGAIDLIVPLYSRYFDT